MHNLKVKYRDNIPCQDFEFVDGKSDWIDLRSNQSIALKQGEFALIDLGFAMQLPYGYEAHLVPRSSTFKNFGILQTNSIGIIDNSYCGNEDYWLMSVYATRDTFINKGDRICQFRITKKMEDISITEVQSLNNTNRGGFGSTGVK